MKQNWIWNPKTKGSGIIECIPQKGRCPNNCDDCFFQGGRSYLEPLDKNTPHIPSRNLAMGRIVRVNDGNDSNFQRNIVEQVATGQGYIDYFFNTAVPKDLGDFSGPVVLTVNPGKMTDQDFYKLKEIPDNLMFVRIRTNTWNLFNIVDPAVSYYTNRGVAVVLTFMAYYTTLVPQDYKKYYEWKKRTLNSYWILKQEAIGTIMHMFRNNALVYSCGYKDRHECIFCGNCLREYYNAKERLRGNAERMVPNGQDD